MPIGTMLAASWNPEMMEELYEWEGKELLRNQIDTLLGPGMNIHRSPLNGRNFEYFSEDPYLASQMAAAHIKGVQSKNVGTSIKHFAANNQEHRRMSCSSEIDERTFREIYLALLRQPLKKQSRTQ